MYLLPVPICIISCFISFLFLFADESINLFKQLEQTAKVFEDYIDVYRENEDVNAFRMVNDIKMLFERLFLVQHKGFVLLIFV